jgi:hypothetical protein
MLLLNALACFCTDRATTGRLMAAEPAATLDAGAAVSGIDAAAPRRVWRAIVLHHSATRGGDVAAIDAVHRQQKDRAGVPWRGIGYHFVVGNGRQMADGSIEPTFRWREQLDGAHASANRMNEQAIGICLVGNFDEAAPTAKQIASVSKLVQTLAEQYSIDRHRVFRHQDVQATLCPGRLFPWDQVLAGLPPAKRS